MFPYQRLIDNFYMMNSASYVKMIRIELIENSVFLNLFVIFFSAELFQIYFLGILTLPLHLKTYNFITCILCSQSHGMKAKTIRNYKRFHYAIPYTSRKVLLIPACTQSIKYVMKHNKIRHTTFVRILGRKCFTLI